MIAASATAWLASGRERRSSWRVSCTSTQRGGNLTVCFCCLLGFHSDLNGLHSSRCTMYDALQHPMFASLRLDARQTAATLHAAAHPQHGQGLVHVQSLHGSYDSTATSTAASNTVRFLHYYRGAAQVCTPTSGRSHAHSFNLAHAVHHYCDALPIL